MAVYRAQISFPADSALPRDEMSITPHYTGDNPGGLANALKANLVAFPAVASKLDALFVTPSKPV